MSERRKKTNKKYHKKMQKKDEKNNNKSNRIDDANLIKIASNGFFMKSIRWIESNTHKKCPNSIHRDIKRYFR